MWNIRRIIQLVFLFAMISGVTFVFILAELNQSKSRLLSLHNNAQAIAKQASRLSAITNGVASGYSPTHLMQWSAAYNELILLVEFASKAEPESSEIDLMRVRANDLSDLFNGIYSEKEEINSQVIQRRVEILADRMISESQQLVELSHDRASRYTVLNEEASSNFRMVAVVIITITLATVMALLLVIQMRILRPLSKIGSMIKLVQAGDLSARVNVFSRDELGQVAHQMNTFAKTLTARLNSLAEINSRLEVEVHENEVSKERLSVALEDLRVTQSVLEGAGRMCGVGGWDLDLKTNILRWSRQTYEIVEAPLDFKPTVEKAINLYEGDAKEIISRELDRTIQTGQRLDVELPFITFTGRRIWVQIYGELIYEGEGDTKRPVSVTGAFQDITARREQELNLKAAIEQAQSASRAKGDFLANMSHEIRTPLNAVVGLSYMLKKTSLSSDQIGLLDKLESSARTLIELVTDILDLSKIETGNMELDPQPVKMEMFFESLASLGSGLPISSDVDLVFNIDGRLPGSCLVDHTKLKQVLVNLIGNSAKFTSSGFIELEVKVNHLKHSLASVSFRVSDSGIGMEKEVQSRLFQAFSQGDASISRRFGGTGVGLALSQKFVQMMGGNIEVNSKLGEGSTFSFTIQIPFESNAHNFSVKDGGPEREIIVFCDRTRWLDSISGIAHSMNWKIRCTDSYAELAGLDTFATSNADRPIVLVCDPKFDSNIQTVTELNTGIFESKKTAIIFVEQGRHFSMGGEAICKLFDVQARVSMPLTASILTSAINLVSSEHVVDQRQNNPHPLAGLRILAVDDNKMNLMVLRGVLEHSGAEVFEALDGQQAVELLCDETKYFDICLMDVQMPKMNGLEATQIVRKQSVRPEIPIIALTAGAMLAEHQNAIKAGMDDVLTKPIDSEAVIKSILSHLSMQTR